MNPRATDLSDLFPQSEFDPNTMNSHAPVSHGDQTGEWHGELRSSTLTNSARTRNKHATFVVSTKPLGTMFSKSL